MNRSVCILAAGLAASLPTPATPAVPAGQPLGLPAFHELSVAGPFEVAVATGHGQRVIAAGDPRLLALTEVFVKDGRLEIRVTRGVSIDDRRYGRARFTIDVPRLDEASIAGSGPLTIDRVANDFSASVAGSGTMRIGQLQSGRARLTTAGSGGFEVAGSVDRLDLSSAGSGSVRAAGLASRSLSVSVAGSGSIVARSSGNAQVSMVGSGSVRVLGGARCSVSRIGSGTIDCPAN